VTFHFEIAIPTTKREWAAVVSRQMARLHAVLQQALVTYVEYDEVHHEVEPVTVNHEVEPEVVHDPLWPVDTDTDAFMGACATFPSTGTFPVQLGKHHDQMTASMCRCYECQARQARAN
jgi:hypothetical protein